LTEAQQGARRIGIGAVVAVTILLVGAAGVAEVPVRIVGDVRAVSTVDATTRFLAAPVVLVGRARRRAVVDAAYQHIEIYDVAVELIARDPLGAIGGRKAIILVRRDAVEALPDGTVNAVVRSVSESLPDAKPFVLLYLMADRRIAAFVPLDADSATPADDLTAAARRLPKASEARLLDERVARSATTRHAYVAQLEHCPESVLQTLIDARRRHTVATFSGCPR
jgi:hypothetical protein